MASREINTGIGNDQPSFLNLGERIKIRDFTSSLVGIMKVEGIPDIVIAGIESSIYSCVHSYITSYSLLKSDNGRDEFRNASKRHNRTLNSVLTYIVQSLKTDGYETTIHVFGGVIEVKIGSLTVMSEEIHPRSFKSWYNALRVLHTVGKLITTEQAVVICRVLTSVYNIVNEPMLTESEKARSIRDQVKVLSTTPRWTTIDDYKVTNSVKDPVIRKGVEDIKETIRQLSRYVSDLSLRPPKWAVEMVRALRSLKRNQRLFIYDNIRTMLSANSTCSSMIYKGKRVTIPGLFASCIEKDYYKENYPNSNLDTIIQFKQDYCISDDFAK